MKICGYEGHDPNMALCEPNGLGGTHCCCIISNNFQEKLQKFKNYLDNFWYNFTRVTQNYCQFIKVDMLLLMSLEKAELIE